MNRSLNEQQNNQTNGCMINKQLINERWNKQTNEWISKSVSKWVNE